MDLTPSEQLLTAAEIQRLVKLFVRAGVTKLRFTGGEPTVRKDLLDIIAAAGSLRSEGLDAICLTTNGIVLGRKLPALIEAGLTHVNISLDTLDEMKFQIMTRRMGGKQVRNAIQDAVHYSEAFWTLKAERDAAAAAAVATTTGDSTTPSQFSSSSASSSSASSPAASSLSASAPSSSSSPPSAFLPGLRSVKLNCVMMKALNDMELLDFVELTRDQNLEVRFIEYMPFDGNRWTDQKFFSYKEMIERIQAKYPGLHKLPTEKNETAKTYAIPGFKGRLGFITSMTEHFCSSCNRLRMTADGNLKVCLFGNEEISLRDAMRKGKTDEELA